MVCLAAPNAATDTFAIPIDESCDASEIAF